MSEMNGVGISHPNRGVASVSARTYLTRAEPDHLSGTITKHTQKNPIELLGLLT